MGIVFEGHIDGEPVFKGIINNKPFRVLFVRTDTDYGWQFLDYLPSVSATEAGTDQLTFKEYEYVLDEYLPKHGLSELIVPSSLATNQYAKPHINPCDETKRLHTLQSDLFDACQEVFTKHGLENGREKWCWDQCKTLAESILLRQSSNDQGGTL